MTPSFDFESPRTVKTAFAVLLTLNATLVALDLIFNYSGWITVGSIRRLFNMAREDSLPGWLSSMYLLSAALMAWVVFFVGRRRGWSVVAAFFTFLAVDDGSGAHERIGTAAKTWTASSDSSFHFPSYTWQLVYGPFLLGMALFLIWYLLRELRNSRQKLLFLLALSCFGFAESVDFVEGVEGLYDSIASSVGVSPSFIGHYGRVTEEFFENLGATLFLTCFMSYFFSVTRQIMIRFSAPVEKRAMAHPGAETR